MYCFVHEHYLVLIKHYHANFLFSITSYVCTFSKRHKRWDLSHLCDSCSCERTGFLGNSISLSLFPCLVSERKTLWNIYQRIFNNITYLFTVFFKQRSEKKLMTFQGAFFFFSVEVRQTFCFVGTVLIWRNNGFLECEWAA